MNIRNKVYALVLAMCMVITSVSPAFAFSNLRAKTTKIRGDYYKQYAVTLFNKKQLKAPNKGVTLKVNKSSKSLVISGTNKKLIGTKIKVNKKFNFNGNSIGRFSIDASAKKGQKVKIAFYLDKSKKPFFTTQLVKQKKKNTWKFSKDVSKDVMDKGIKGKHSVSFAILSSSASKNTSISIRSFEFVESSVPVVYLDIDEKQGTIAAMNADSKHATECHGDMTIKVPKNFTSEYTNEPLEGGTYAMEYIRGRGHSTWNMPKKPYKIKLDKKANLLGMGENKHWVLLANALDDGMLRNKITYWLSDQLGMPFTSQSEPVDVVMNGEYLGSYMLAEHVRIGSNRVDIDDLEDTNYTTEPEITGGYLLSRGPSDDEDEHQVFATERNLKFKIESPEFKDKFNEAQYNYIKNYVQKVETALYADGFKSGNQSYKDLMDVTSAVLYYWVQEFSMNWDGYGSSSVFLYKPRNGKLYWGPLWDFDFSAWGATEYSSPYVEGWIQNGGGVNSWNGRMFEDPEFVAAVKAEWPQVKALIEQLIRKDGQLDWYADRIRVSARYNYEKWTFNSQDELKSVTYNSEIKRLRNWISARLQWVDKNLDTIDSK